MTRRSPRALLLWPGAVMVAVVTAVFVAGDLASLHRRAATLGATHPVAVAAADLPVGTVRGSSDLETRTVHRSQLPDGVAARPRRATASSRSRGRRGAYVLDRNLTPRRREPSTARSPEGCGRSGSSCTTRCSRTPGPRSTCSSPSSPPRLGRSGRRRRVAAAPVAARGVFVLGTDDDPATIDAGTPARPTASGSRSS